VNSASSCRATAWSQYEEDPRHSCGTERRAEAALSRGITAFDSDARPKIPGERALWLYKRGLARTNLDAPPTRVADLQNALEAHPLGWTEAASTWPWASRRPRRQPDRAVAEYAKAKTACKASPMPVQGRRRAWFAAAVAR
jgi:hypothetical protein